MDARRAVCSDICSSQCRTHAPVAVSVGSDSTAFRNAAQRLQPHRLVGHCVDVLGDEVDDGHLGVRGTPRSRRAPRGPAPGG